MARTVKTRSRAQKPKAGKKPPSTPRPAPPSNISQFAQPLASEIVVDQEQSLELVRTVISAAISNITWIRDVFPNDCYESRVYDFSDPDPSYEAFMNGKKPFVLEKNQNLAYWRVLVRGSDPGVDKFLDWLEQGVAHALERKFLSSLQLSFYDGEVSPSALVEAYVVSITYNNGVPSMQVDTESRVGKKTVATSLLLSDAKLGIRNLINGIIVSAQDMPGELPPNHVADMHLTYNDNCPKDYNPPGFRACHDPNFIISDKMITRCDSLNTGHHGIRIRLFSKPPKEVEPVAAPFAAAVPGPSHPRGPSLSSDFNGGETQESGLNALRSIGIARDPVGISQDTQPLQGNNSQPHIENRADLSSQDSPAAIQPYSQAVKLRIEHARRQRAREFPHSAGDNLGVAPVEGLNISCECEYPTWAADSHEIMLQCDICNYYKHAQCYGHWDAPHISEFVCYTCLLEGEDTLILDMSALCVKRRVLFRLRLEGCAVSGKDIAAHLDRDEIVTKIILHELELQGMVQRHGTQGKQIFGEPLFSLGLDHEKLERDYFSPTLNIAHHLALVGTFSPATLPGQSLSKRTQPSGVPTTSQRVLDASTSHHDRGRQPLLHAHRAGEGSSTQGTPSPSTHVRYSPTRQPRTPLQEMALSTPHGKKRAADAGLGGGSRKQVKLSSARSPWLFGRK